MAPNTPQSTPARSLTFGEKAVGITFNPGGKPEVETIKRKAADLIDELNNQMESGDKNGEQIAQFKLAIRKIQEGQMWAVKAATWQY